jgi:hypothetical protein
MVGRVVVGVEVELEIDLDFGGDCRAETDPWIDVCYRNGLFLSN